jgi:hypothetical protein
MSNSSESRNGEEVVRYVISVLREPTRSRLDREDRKILAAKLEDALSCGLCDVPRTKPCGHPLCPREADDTSALSEKQPMVPRVRPCDDCGADIFVGMEDK